MLGLHSDLSIESFFSERFSQYRSTISQVSRSDDGRFSVESDVLAWNFDGITGSYFSRIHPYSTDCILFSNNNIYFVEFKSGLDKLVDWSNFDPNGICCRVLGDRPCHHYGILLRQRDDYKEKMLLLNFQMKASDSYKTFERKIIPEIDCSAEIYREYRLHLVAVVDCDNVENSLYENILFQMSESNPIPTTNHITKIQNALNKFRESEFWFDEVLVYGKQEFQDFLRDNFS